MQLMILKGNISPQNQIFHGRFFSSILYLMRANNHRFCVCFFAGYRSSLKDCLGFVKSSESINLILCSPISISCVKVVVVTLLA